jgi:uncharacterized protein (UPF0332 family)
MSIVSLRINGRELRPHKAVVSPRLGTRTVLTNSPWGFVDLWLKREGHDEAVFFWDQAREFHAASRGVGLQSAPLLLYYSFMNAAKALLAAKRISFNPHHGIRAANVRKPTDRITLSNEAVKVLDQGVLPSISSYFGETEAQKVHSLQEIFFNLPFIHRSYCLTYKSQPDLFIPLTDCEYVFDSKSKELYFRAHLSKDFARRGVLKQLPATLISDPAAANVRAIRSAASTSVKSGNVVTKADKQTVMVFNRELRRDLQYIAAVQTLWYAKGIVKGPRRLARSPLTLTLAAMHRLSELCRYRPIELGTFLSGQQNWLLSEFILAAPNQFIDGLASEITGHQFMAPNVRPAT